MLMKSNLFQPIRLFTFLSLFSYLVNFSSCSPAIATWYGPPYGAGSEGGACGYEHDVAIPPINSMISAGSPSIYQGGRGCGTCYQVRCRNAPCSGYPVTVTITDECPGCSGVHFDLSGTAFGAMAKPGQADALRSLGKIQIDYTRVQCDYHRTPITFKVDKGSNPNYFSCVVEYEWGDGDIASLELQPAGWKTWLPMQRLWGATWKINLDSGKAKAPFSIRLTQIESRRSVTAFNVIPANWKPGEHYRSNV